MFKRYKCNIYIFEPISSFYNELVNKFKDNNKIKLFEFGLFNKNKKTFIYKSKDASSIFIDKEPKEEINLVDINDFVISNNINNVDLIEINVEGAEYDILDRMIEKNIVKIFKNIQIQFHTIVEDYNGRRNRICNELSKTHYRTWNYEFNFENWKLKEV